MTQARLRRWAFAGRSEKVCPPVGGLGSDGAFIGRVRELLPQEPSEHGLLDFANEVGCPAQRVTQLRLYRRMLGHEVAGQTLRAKEALRGPNPGCVH